jgi:RHS repeat-associated protein
VSQYATHQKDATGLHYADQRYYQSSWGRFLTPDPAEAGDLGAPQSLNLYAYVMGDPVNLNDPEGLEVTVPVRDSPVPTCLTRVFREVITPSGFGTTNDDNAATNFFSSLEGTFGLSLFFEVRPSGYTTDRSSPVYQAALGVGFVYINRYIAQWGAESGFHSLEKVVMDASTPIWEPGSGDSRQMRSRYRNTLYSILNGAPNDNKGDCDGLIWSLHLGQSMIAHSVGVSHSLPHQLYVYNPVGNALAFHSYNNTNVPKGWDKRFRYTKTISVPKFGGGYGRFNFFELPGVVLPTH